MTAQELHSSMHEIFKEPDTGIEAEMRIDFRKISAKYVCVGDGRESMCVRFESTKSGLCKFKNDGFCSSF
jgi:hypothetical protein